MLSDDYVCDGQMNLAELYPELQVHNAAKSKPICKFSNHECNKKVLHEMATEMNPFCPKVCCRFCNEKLCGVRCNGANG